MCIRDRYELGCGLQSLWRHRGRDDANLHEALLEWCRQAEKSGLESLQAFSARIKGYTLKPCRVTAPAG